MKKIPISLQMFSLRAMWEENPLAAMRTVKAAGYQGVEFYGQHYKADLYAALLKECDLVCSGRVRGNLMVQNQVTLNDRAVIAGNITTGTMSMMRGAMVSGNLKMSSSTQKVTVSDTQNC